MDEIFDRIKNTKIPRKYLIAGLISAEILGILVLIWFLRVPLTQKFLLASPKAYSVEEMNPQKRYVVKQGDFLVGKNEANSAVKVFIGPEKIISKIASSENGKWSYQIPLDLATTSHSLSIAKFNKENMLTGLKNYKIRVTPNNFILKIFKISLIRQAFAQDEYLQEDIAIEEAPATNPDEAITETQPVIPSTALENKEPESYEVVGCDYAVCGRELRKYPSSNELKSEDDLTGACYSQEINPACHNELVTILPDDNEMANNAGWPCIWPFCEEPPPSPPPAPVPSPNLVAPPIPAAPVNPVQTGAPNIYGCEKNLKNSFVGVRLNFSGDWKEQVSIDSIPLKKLGAGGFRINQLPKEKNQLFYDISYFIFTTAAKCDYQIVYLFNPDHSLSRETIKNDLKEIMDIISKTGKNITIELGNEPNNNLYWKEGGDKLDEKFSTFADFIKTTQSVIRDDYKSQVPLIIGALDLQWGLKDYIESNGSNDQPIYSHVQKYYQALSSKVDLSKFDIAVHAYHEARSLKIINGIYRAIFPKNTKYWITEAGVTLQDNPDELLRMIQDSKLSGDVKGLIVHEFNGTLPQEGVDFRLWVKDESSQRESYQKLNYYLQNYQ